MIMADDASQASAAAPGGSGGGGHQLAPAEQGLRCPRCDSPNTKFCYYNNYSLAQPRHYCKTCRRYWTKGGALRNVPVGGGCRKNKRSKSSSSSTTSSRLSLDNFSSDGSTSESAGAAGLKFLTSLPSLGVLPFSSRAAAAFGDHMISPLSASSAAPLLGFNNYPVSAVGVYTDVGHANNSIASSIESLSSINQELHWKLQQQRLAMFGSGVSSPLAAPYLENQQDAIIQLEPTNYAMHSSSIATSAADTTMTMAINNSTGSNNAGMWSSTATPWPAWSEMPQFGTL